MKYWIVLLFTLKSVFCFCQVNPSSQELNQMTKMTGREYVVEFTGFNNDYDTTKYYLKFFKWNDWTKPVACFVYRLHPTWDNDYHFIICDCKPLDSAYQVAKKRYWKTHKK